MTKRSIRCFFASLALLPVLLSCNGREDNSGKATVRFSVRPDSPVAEITRSNVSDFTALPSGDDFTIVITDSKENVVYSGLVKDYPADKAYSVGNYSVKASYGSVSDEGFDKPCFIGTQGFTVTGGSTNDVTVNVKLANAIVRIACSEMFTKYYTDYTFTLKTGNGTVISYPKSETRAVFVDAYTLTVEGELTTQAGKTATFSKAYSSALSEATCYTLKFDASNIGSGSISITFDNSTDDVDLGFVELND